MSETWAGQERRSEPSNKDIITLLSANSGTLGELGEKIKDVREDVSELKAMAKSYVTHDALQLQLDRATALSSAEAARAAALPVAAAAIQSGAVAEMVPRVNTLWGERSFVKGALWVLLAVVGTMAPVIVGVAIKIAGH